MINFFTIEDTRVSYSFDLLSSNEISISSVPYSYSVSFVNEVIMKEELEKSEAVNKDKHFIFIDDTVAKLYSDSIFKRQQLHTLIAKESNKALPAVTKLIDLLESKNFSKREMFISAGGGITQDVSSFVRAIYKRGINWTFIPTTLLAMSDSCIGAKACLNYGGVKNQLGLFSAPQKVFINSSLLKTLNEKDVLSGYGEIIKLCIIGGQASIGKFKEMTKEQGDDKLINIDDLIRLSLTIKKAVIEIDEFENDIRRALNYGHTVGHAIEPLTNYKIPHGIAISIGMIIENLIAAEFGSFSKDEALILNNMIYPFIDKKSLKVLKNINVDNIISNMKKDKKAMSDDIYMAVPFAIGYFNMLKVSSGTAFRDFLEVSINGLLS